MPGKNNLQGKVALVTGASRGIGRAIALGLAGAGADIAVNFRERETEAHEVCAEIEKLGRRAIAVRADVSRQPEVERIIGEIAASLGDVSILVNNAGISRAQKIEEITEQDFDDLIRVNLKSVFLVTQAVLPKMREAKWGRIINISSTAAQIGGVVGPHYAASKAGIIGLTHSYASNLVKEGITANAIAPALIETDMVKKDLKVTSDRIPVGRFGEAEEIVGAAILLAENAYITGQTININGGIYFS